MISYKKNNKVVYAHRKKSDGNIFYIGIGNPHRPYNFESRSDFWKRTAQKHGVEVEILNTGLTWEQACEIEISLIKAFGRRDIGTGCLVNMTDGGDGAANPSERVRKAIGDAERGEKHHYYGVTGKAHPAHKSNLKPEAIIAISNSLRNGKNGKSKLCPTTVNIIKKLYNEAVQSGKKRGAVKKIASQFNVSYACIYDICVRKKCWNYDVK